VPTSVRRARPDDHEAAAELTAQVYRSAGYSTEQYEPALRDIGSRAATATVLVAEVDGHMAGTVTVASRGGEWAEQAVAGEAVIRMLVVDPAARGAGLGEALVRACLEEARADGCSLVRLSSQEAMTDAHRLYERLGFLRTPGFDWSPEPGVELRTYALPLVPWCGQCGEELTPEGHGACRRAADLDPPRFCGHCRRRRVVQVTPTGWTARCVEHGEQSG
jgi:ribosomal protein S18 acetylase RimI-like enzyme